MRVMIATLALMLAWPAAAPALPPRTIEVECPLTGERFEYQSFSSRITMGSGLDGLPYSTVMYSAPPECPGSKMPVYREFTAEEKARLAAFAQTDEYRQAMDEQTFYRLGIVQKALGESQPLVVGSFLAATWYAPEDRRARYIRAYTVEVDTWLAQLSPSQPQWWFANLEAANVEREFGDFKAAQQRLARLGAAPGPRPEGTDDWIGLTERLIKAKDVGEYLHGPAAAPLKPHPLANRH